MVIAIGNSSYRLLLSKSGVTQGIVIINISNSSSISIIMISSSSSSSRMVAVEY